MGLWWKRVSVESPENECVVFEGDPKAFSKKWWPVLWRFGQNWALLRVRSELPFYMYFESEGTTMSYKTPLNKHIVFVRVGPKAVRFWAIDVAGHLVKVAFDGQWIQAPLRQDDFKGRLPRSAPAFYRQHYPFI
jgi:hypothetical protein